MAFNPILDTEIQTGAPLDNALLDKVQDNFADHEARLVNEEMDVNVVRAYQIVIDDAPAIYEASNIEEALVEVMIKVKTNEELNLSQLASLSNRTIALENSKITDEAAIQNYDVRITSNEGTIADLLNTVTALSNTDRQFTLDLGTLNTRATDIEIHKASLNSPAFTGIPTAPTASFGTNTNQIATTSFVSSAIGSIGNGIPSGIVAQFAGPIAPAGWLLCDGAIVSRSLYQSLFNAIGTAHGQGDGSTTFALPDYRGRFLRGVDGGTGRDPDRATRTAANTGGNTGDNVGSVQADMFASHNHSASFPGQVSTHSTGATSGTYRNSGAGAFAVSVAANGGNETRPKNANVHYIIKI